MAAFDNAIPITQKSDTSGSVHDLRHYRLPRPRPESDDDYEPRDHRQPDSIPVWMAYFNMIRSMCGAGLLGMPLAVSQAGIVFGPILLVLIGILLLHTHRMLLLSLNDVSRQLKIPIISYRYGFRLAILQGPPILHTIGEYGPYIISIFMILSQLGICTVFVIFTTDNLRDIMDWQHSNYSLYALIGPYLLLELAMKNLKMITYISVFGTAMFLTGLLLVFSLIFFDPHGLTIYFKFDTVNFLFATGNFLFNMSSVGVILLVDSKLKDPKIMTTVPRGVVFVGLTFLIVIASIFGTLGYWSFGTMEENILRSLPYDENLSMVAMVFYLIGVALGFPLQCYPAVSLITDIVKLHDPLHEPPPETLAKLQLLLRPVFVITTFIICYFIPFQGPFIAFVGNLCTSVLVLICPSLMDISLRYPDKYGRRYWILFKDLFILGCGMISLIFGVIFCGYLIYIRILTLESPNEEHDGFHDVLEDFFDEDEDDWSTPPMP